MQLVTLRGHVGIDGIMHLQVPVGTPDADVEVVVIFQPIVEMESYNKNAQNEREPVTTQTFHDATPTTQEAPARFVQVSASSKKTPEELGWPPGFFERTFGSIPDLERAPQGELQEREPF